MLRCAQKRCFSLNELKDLSKFVVGLKEEDVEKNEEIAAYLRANVLVNDSMQRVHKNSKEVNEDTPIEQDSTSLLNIRKIGCFKRHIIDEEGSRRCRDLRDLKNEIPGLLFGGDPTKGISSQDLSSKIFVKTIWKVLHRELDRYHRSFESRVYDLIVYEDTEDTEGVVHRVVPTGVQRHPIQNKLFCVNYLRYHPMRPLNIPIVYANEEESPALKRGGYIAPIKRYVSCLVEDGAPIPEKLELECTGLELKDVIRLDRIILPEGVTISRRVKPENFIIGTVFGRRADATDDE